VRYIGGSGDGGGGLRRISGPRGSEVLGDWTGLHNEELIGLYSSPGRIITVNRVCSGNGEKMKAYRILSRKAERDH
jgi:hypothetical protein